MRRVFPLLLVGLLVAPACGEPFRPRERTLGFVTTTERLAKQYVYTEEAAGKKVAVSGRIEDALRYQQTLRLEGSDVLEEIVSDDTIAVRVMDAVKLPAFASGTVAAGEHPLVIETLRSGGWVLNPSGAPPLEGSKVGEGGPGADPLLDAVSVLRYVRNAIQQAANVKQYREDDLDPAYRPAYDPFPKPDDKAGIRRFDLIRTALPLPDQALGGGLAAFPKTSTFRKMAIYVKGEVIVRVLEDIDVDGHEDFVEARQKGRKRVLSLLGAIKSGQAQERIRPRKMSVAFTFPGGKIAIRTPDDALTAGFNLDGLFQGLAFGEGGFGGGGGAPGQPLPPGGEATPPPEGTGTPAADGSPSPSPAG